jgi:hypothetical protein
MKLGLLAALAAAAVTLIVPATSSASPYIRYGVQDDAYLSPGSSLEARLRTLDQLGAEVFRYMVNWRQVAAKRPRHPADPDDPAYDWTKTDPVLRGLHAHGITALVTLYRTPAWASRGRGMRAVPTTRYSLAAFAVAVARRYPWVRLWEVWNEPNLRSFLAPNSPRLYVQKLLNPTYAALHALNPANRVAGGATAPRSTRTGLSPIAFMRGMHRARARIDAYSHHPYPVTRGERPFGFARGVCRYCKGVLTLANLPVLLREVRKDFGRKRVWLTEYGYQTDPPDPSGVSRAAQAQYIAESALRVRKAPLVDVLIHFMLRDESRPAGWQSGLFSTSGLVKPAFNSFRLPIVEASRHGLRTTIWGQVRPGSGRRWYRLELVAHGRWAPVGRLSLTTARGFYTRVVGAERGTRFRIVAPALAARSRAIVVR